MSKVIKKLANIATHTIAGVVLAIILLVLAVALAFSLPRVQTFAAHKIVDYLSEYTNTRVDIRSISVENISSLVVEGLYIEDLRGDTLLWVDKASATIDRDALLAEGKLLPRNVRIQRGYLNMDTDAEGELNLDQIVSHYESLFPADTTKETAPFLLENLDVEELRYRLYDTNLAGRVPEGVIDYSDMELMIHSVHIGSIGVDGIVVTLKDITNLTAIDRSGAYLEKSSMSLLEVGDAVISFHNIDFRSGNTRLSLPYLILEGQDWKEYSDFNESIVLHLKTSGSSLDPSTAGLFVHELGAYQLEGSNIDGTFHGPVCDFVADLSALLYDTEVEVSGSVTHIAHPADMSATLELAIHTTPAKVENIYRRVVGSDLPAEALEWLSKVDTLALSGEVVAEPNIVKPDMLIATNMGRLAVEGTLGYGERVSYTGTIGTSDLEVGRLLGMKELGKVDLTLDGSVAVESGRIESSVAGSVENLYWKDYNYAGVGFEALLKDDYLTVVASSDDPNINFSAEAGGALIPSDTAEYTLVLNLARANLSTIGLADSERQAWLSGSVEASLTGRSIDDMVGRAMINNLTFANAADTLSTELVNISLAGGASNKSFTLQSSVMDVEYHSSAPYAEVVEYLGQKLPAALPLGKKEQAATKEGDDNNSNDSNSTPHRGRLYTAHDYSAARIHILDGEHLAGVLAEGANIAPDTSLALEFSPSVEEFGLQMSSDYVALGDAVISELRIGADGAGQQINLRAECEELIAMGADIPEVTIVASSSEGRDVSLDVRFSNYEAALSGRLMVEAEIEQNSRGEVEATATLHDSHLLSPSQRWELHSDNIVYTPSSIAINNFAIDNGAGGLRINGEIADTATTPLQISLTDVAMGEWISLFAPNLNLEGTVDGLVELHSALDAPYGKGELHLSSLSLDEMEIDPLGLNVEIPQRSTQIAMTISNTNLNSTLATGTYDYTSGAYRANVETEEFELALLTPLLSGVADNLKGVVDINLDIAGQKEKLDIDGTVEATGLSTRVDFTGATYSTERLSLNFNNNRGTIAPIRLEDKEGGWAEVEGYVDLNSLSNVGYGLSLVPHNLVAIDLEEDIDAPFWGKVYASGALRLRSERQLTEITGAVTTGKGSVFNLPLKGNNDFAGADFVTFVDHSERVVVDTTHLVVRKKSELRKRNHNSKPAGNTTMDVMLGVDTDTQLRILIDPATDNVIEAKGVADLGVIYDSRKNDLAIRGDYQISEGVYNFNFQNIITKQFTINPGSYLRWNGSPLGANIDVGATYRLKTSLAPLLGTESTASRASTPVECIVNLTGSLEQVDVSFGINVPNANTEYQSILSSYFSSQEMMATQFVYLLALGNFYSDSASTQTNTAGAAGTAIGLDFLAGQVSKLVSNDAYKFNLKYKAIDDTSSSYSIDFQTEIIDDRLLLELEANVDTGDYYQSINGDANQLSGGGAITLLLDDSGDFYLKGFSRTIDRFDENQGLQENGVGLYFKRSFNRFDDLWRKKRERRKVEKESPKPQESKKIGNFVANLKENYLKYSAANGKGVTQTDAAQPDEEAATHVANE